LNSRATSTRVLRFGAGRAGVSAVAAGITVTRATGSAIAAR
jgi:hypothetical protein